ncbi:ABC transporter permease [Rossellomorea marisflavi]|uniref:ABC transporter permease n=1 Tax=Rossellomorea marisflavi TaxID=189381 RepID=UPI0034587A6F
MRNILTIAFNTMTRYMKEKRVVLMMVVFPIVLILILGNALKTSFEPGNLGSINVAVLNQDQAEVSGYFDDFIQSDEVTDMVKISKVDSVQEAENQLEKQSIDSFIYIAPGYSDAITTEDKKAQIEVKSTDLSGYKATVVNSIVDSFVNGANLTSALNQLTDESSGTSRYEGEEVVKDVVLTTSGERPTAMSYYAITMLVMILMYGIAYSAEGLSEEMFGSMKLRFRSLPVKNQEMFIGKTLGSIVLLLVQGLIIVGITYYFFNVDWGPSIGFVIFMLFIISVFATSLGIMLCTISRDVNQIRGLINILVPVFTFISGGYFKVDLGLVKYLSPNYIMQSAFFTNIYGGNNSDTFMYVGIILALILIMGMLAMVQGRRKLA